MRIGLSTYGLSANETVELARDADAAGFDGLWIGEHLLAPRAYGTAHPQSGAGFQQHSVRHADPSVHLVDPLTTLAAAAALTDRIELATGIYVAPLRHPLQTARMVCTLQEIARGRLVLGVGAGWLAEEFAAFDVPFDTRFRRLEDTLGIVRDALAGGWVSRDRGEYLFDEVQVTAEPMPVPVVLGGNTPRAITRAVRLADGWFSSGTPTLDEALVLRERIADAIAEADRTEPLRTTFRMPGADPADLHRWTDAGFDDIVLWASAVWPVGDPTNRRAVIAEHAAALGVGH